MSLEASGSDVCLFVANQLSKTYESRGGKAVEAVRPADFSLAPGGLVALTGPSGSGKSTLLSLLGAVERPTAGTLTYRGLAIHSASDVELGRVRREFGLMFQDYALLPGLTAVDNIIYALIPRDVARRERGRIADRWLKTFGLQEFRDHRASELSGGERQRLALARALAGEPQVLLADEPTSNLDPATADITREVLKSFADHERTVIVATHDPQLIDAAQQVLNLEVGQVTQTGATSDATSDPREDP